MNSSRSLSWLDVSSEAVTMTSTEYMHMECFLMLLSFQSDNSLRECCCDIN